MAEKRINELSTASSITNGDYLAMDNASDAASKKTSAMPLANVQGASDAYSSTTAYEVGDLVIHDNALYECTTACSAGSWATNSGKFTAKTITKKISELNSALTAVNITVTKYGSYGVDHYEAKLKNNRVQLNMVARYSGTGTAPVGTRMPFASIPSNYAPYRNTWGVAYPIDSNGNAQAAAGCYIDTSGMIYWSVVTTMSTPIAFAVSISYDLR